MLEGCKQGIDEAGQRYRFCLGGGCPTARRERSGVELVQAPRPHIMASGGQSTCRALLRLYRRWLRGAAGALDAN